MKYRQHDGELTADRSTALDAIVATQPWMMRHRDSRTLSAIIEVSALKKNFSSSLIAENQFPVSARNFPVLERREFGGNRLTYISESGASAGLEAQSRENSLYFPVYQGNLLRDDFAADCQHSHTKQLLTVPRPENRHQMAVVLQKHSLETQS